MTRTERLAKQGKTDTQMFGVVKIGVRGEVLRNLDMIYEMTDFEHNVDLYTNKLTGETIAILI